MESRRDKFTFHPPGTNRPEIVIEDHEQRLGIPREQFVALVIGVFHVQIRGYVEHACMTFAIGETATTTIGHIYDDAEQVIRSCIDGVPDDWDAAGAIRDDVGWRLAILTPSPSEAESIINHLEPIIDDNLRAIERFHAGN